MFQSVPIADIDQPPPTGDTPDPLVQLRFGESGSTTVLEIARDNIGPSWVFLGLVGPSLTVLGLHWPY